MHRPGLSPGPQARLHGGEQAGFQLAAGVAEFGEHGIGDRGGGEHVAGDNGVSADGGSVRAQCVSPGVGGAGARRSKDADLAVVECVVVGLQSGDCLRRAQSVCEEVE